MRLFSFLVLAAALVTVAAKKGAGGKLQSLKDTVNARATVFKINRNDIFAKYSKIGQKVVLSQTQQHSGWSKVKGSQFDAFAGTAV